MSDVLITCESVSKKFSRSLNKSMLHGVSDVLLSTIGIAPRTHKLRKDEFWAVNDISIKLKQGEVLGIIGPNGSGKTTFLRMLNGIFMPDNGSINIKRKVSALIQVGAGFHPMLSGRENIYINGSILGMSKKEIDKKFDAIVNFANIEKFLDAPVKHYSSGMYVRLGFSIAIHCDPEILLVDEILSVGDSAFRQKCFQKMNEIKKGGASIVFVSHDLFSVAKFCTTAMFLYKGKMQSAGDTHRIIRDYQSLVTELLDNDKGEVIPGMPHTSNEIIIKNIRYIDQKGKDKDVFKCNEKIGFRIEFDVREKVKNPIIQISLVNREGVHIAIFATHIDEIIINEISKDGYVECLIDSAPLLLNTYYITTAFYDETHSVHLAYWNGLMKNKYFKILPNRTSEKMVEFTPICDFKKSWVLNDQVLN